MFAAVVFPIYFLQCHLSFLCFKFGEVIFCFMLIHFFETKWLHFLVVCFTALHLLQHISFMAHLVCMHACNSNCVTLCQHFMQYSVMQTVHWFETLPCLEIADNAPIETKQWLITLYFCDTGAPMSMSILLSYCLPFLAVILILP